MNSLGPAWDCHVHVFDGGTPRSSAHYTPPLCDLQMLGEAATPSAVSRFVLVQPSVYGTDNRVLLDTLAAQAGRHRGVVVVDASVTDATLQSMHALGVRGVRCNLVSPVGNSHTVLAALAPRLAELAWHVQWYATPEQLTDIAAFQARHRVVCVLDHLAGMNPQQAAKADNWDALQRVADGGGWIKLSGWYRLQASAPYAELDDTIRRASSLFGERCVWGSDWPHTLFLEPGCSQPRPDYAQTLQPVQRALGAALADQVLRVSPPRLYQ